MLVAAARLYHEARARHRSGWLFLAGETLCAVALVHNLHLAYDGVCFLPVADFMRGQGKRARGLWLFLLLALLYFAANFNGEPLRLGAESIEAYFAPDIPFYIQLFHMLKSFFRALGLAAFLTYVFSFLHTQRKERTRIETLNQQLAEANFRLRAYALQAKEAAQVQERNRLAREIHDTLGHTLTGIIAGLDACLATIEAAPDFTRAQLPKIRALAARGMKDVRRSVARLRPDDLEGKPFAGALQAMVMEYMEATDMKISLQLENMPPLRTDAREVVYRIVQEGMTNARRHGKAKHLQIAMYVQDGMFCLRLQDDGQGAKKIKPGFGLRHMQERVELLQGTLHVEGTQGFLIEARWPLPQTRRENA